MNEHDKHIANPIIKSISASLGEKKLYQLIEKWYFHGWQIQRQVRLADVIDINYLKSNPKEFETAKKLSFDIVIVDERNDKPTAAYEFDGPFHQKPIQKLLDSLKNRICKDVNFPLIRFNYYLDIEFLDWIEQEAESRKDPRFPYTTENLKGLYKKWRAEKKQ